MPNIYNIPNWLAGTNYEKDETVKHGAYYYYALLKHSNATPPSSDNTNWGGVTTNGIETKPAFIWTPSYGYNINIQPRIKTIIFGDGYSQDIRDGINNVLLVLDLNFSERGLYEYSAITHFLNTRAGSESFFFTPPQPFGNLKKFKCKKFTPLQTFYNNYSLQATFEESVV
jgi:phage-related protein